MRASWFVERFEERFPPVTDPARRRLLAWEVVVVLAVTFGMSGIRAALRLLDSALDTEPIAEQTVTMNRSLSAQQVIDVLLQLTNVGTLLAWAALPLILLAHSGDGLRSIGLTGRRWPRQLWWGVVLTAVIGIPGLALYFGSVAAGINLNVAPSGLGETWWRPIVLTLAAFGNGAAEEIVVVGYLLVRLRQLGWGPWSALAASALLRASYHLYQGLGGGLGNLLMGLVFALWWMRYRRMWPLIVAHTLLDVVAFVGYALLAPHVGWLPSPG